MIGGRVLDTTALTDYATGRIYARALVGAAQRSGALVLAVPAAALLAARAQLSEPARAVLRELVALAPAVVDELTAETAGRCGDLSARARARPPGETVDAAHVAFSARTRGWPVVTAAPERLLALDAALQIERLP
ncbi:hypothetical protein [Streptomonospora wellingtoniae]|uniref:PIN domain-containing protein n=1 Tax=Streptomonospora wellingtoniae TaxID=3075544 RepID=A0ABU2L080_9ACTN|nr:hypothetical protein [Streptomonospora sp. DSM 45055]MDT0304966.1 hypothetical protein [Streptomonospora sp. DSM 45055]